MELGHGSLQLGDDVQDECADDAVEPIARNVVGFREIGYQGGQGVRVIDMKDVDLGDRRLAEARRVPVRPELQAVATDVGAVLLEKLLSVVPTDGQTPVMAPEDAQGLTADGEAQPRPGGLNSVDEKPSSRLDHRPRLTSDDDDRRSNTTRRSSARRHRWCALKYRAKSA